MNVFVPFLPSLTKNLSEVKPSDADKIDKLTLDELQDLDKIAGIADFMLTKYADKKEMYSILKHFTPIITETMILWVIWMMKFLN